MWGGEPPGDYAVQLPNTSITLRLSSPRRWTQPSATPLAMEPVVCHVMASGPLPVDALLIKALPPILRDITSVRGCHPKPLLDRCVPCTLLL